jgi:hypothetical protein
MTTPGYPEYVVCAQLGYKDDARKHESWCGRQVGNEFAFADSTHALLNARRGGRLLLCPKCGEAIAKTLELAVFGEEPSKTTPPPKTKAKAAIVHHAAHGATCCGLTGGRDHVDWTTVTCKSCLRNRPTEPRP